MGNTSTCNDQRHGRWPTTQVTLLERIHDHDDAGSWKQFVDIYGPLVMSYCQRRGLQETDAQDVAQEVMILVSKGIDRFRYDPERGQFRNWLGTVTHRAMLKHLTKISKIARREGGDHTGRRTVTQGSPSLHEEWWEVFASHVFRAATNRIRPEFDEVTWHAFNANYVESLSADSVAQHLERSVGWVYQAKCKVMSRLKEEILYLAEDSVLVNLPGYNRTIHVD